MGVVDPEDGDPLVHPELHDAEQLLPERAPRRALEVEGIDVLVALRGVLGVLDGAVRAVAEPLGVLGHPGVVGRALEGQVERQLEAARPGRGDDRAEVLERAELGVHRGVAALGRADRPRAAGVAGAGALRVVGALAEGPPDRVDRRQVEDVEAEVGDVVEAVEHVAERPVGRGPVAGGRPERAGPLAADGGRPGEQLVPRAEQRPLALDEHVDDRGGGGVGPAQPAPVQLARGGPARCRPDRSGRASPRGAAGRLRRPGARPRPGAPPRRTPRAAPPRRAARR